MHITCHECDTVFNLDERLLKPSGSKVRCSQCGNVFQARPPLSNHAPEPEPLLEPDSAPKWTGNAGLRDAAVEADTGQELEGIDLAELDAILDGDTADLRTGNRGREDDAPLFDDDDLIHEGDETELDLEFDMNLESGAGDEQVVAKDATDDLLDDIDLDMDFELDTGGKDHASAAAPLIQENKVKQASDHKTVEAARAGDDAPVLTGGGIQDADDLDLDDLDLDFVETEEAAGGTQGPKATAGSQADDLSLDDMELELDGLDEDQETPLAEEPGPLAFESISLDDFENQDEKAVGDAPAASATPVEEAGESLDLDDLDLEEITRGAAPGPAEDEPIVEEELSLVDGPVSTPRAPASDEDELDLRLDDLNLEDEKDTPPVGPLRSAEEESVDLDLALNFDDDVPTPPAATPKARPAEDLEEDLDLSDLGDILDEPYEDNGRQGKEDLELSLSLDGEPTRRKDDSAGPLLEDLDFELDAEFEDKPVAKVSASEPEAAVEIEAEEAELDLSDIEQMLEGDTLLDEGAASGKPAKEKPPRPLDAGADDELDLQEIEAAIDSPDSGGSSLGPEIDDQDLDLELALDSDARKPEKAAEMDDLDLDLDLDEGPRKAGPQSETMDLDIELEEEVDDLDLELELDIVDDSATAGPMQRAEVEDMDLSDLGELLMEQKDGATSETIDTGDIELEFEVESAKQVEDYEPGRSQTFEAGPDVSFEEPVRVKPAGKRAASRPRPGKKKKGTSKLLVFVLIVLMLGAGGYYGYDPYIKDLLEAYDIQIPYLSQFLNPQPKDPAGTLNLSVLDINSKFMESEASGRLFVITGKVRNGYSVSRGSVLLRGKLFTKGKVQVKSEQVYAGLLIDDQELRTGPIAEIKQRLTRTPGTGDAAAVARPGQSLPFMVVFSDLPEDLDEFVIEKVRSQPMP